MIMESDEIIKRRIFIKKIPEKEIYPLHVNMFKTRLVFSLISCQFVSLLKHKLGGLPQLALPRERGCGTEVGSLGRLMC